MKVAIHYIGEESFEVEARTKAELDALIKAECEDRCWIVEETWKEVVE